MMRRLKRWWQRLVGRPHDDDSHPSTTRHAPGDATRNPDNQTSKPPVAPGGLTLAVITLEDDSVGTFVIGDHVGAEIER